MASSFRVNLREELDYQNVTVKELSAKTGIPKATLDCYLGARANLPTVDAAVKIAQALGVTVEYLVTGVVRDQSGNMIQKISNDIALYGKFREVLEDLSAIPADIQEPIIAMIKTAAWREREKKAKEVKAG
jgi:transcriptional regulator with XRE-family HTH domain